MESKLPIPQITLQQCRLKTGTTAAITRLSNSIYYFLDYVFIIIGDEDYRLLVIHNNRALWDKHYKSIRGARIAFSRHFGCMAFKKNQKPQWTHHYMADEDWLQELLYLAENSN